MRKNLRFVWLLIKCKFTRMMMYRADFFHAFVNDGILFAVQLLAFSAIYSQVDSIGDWSYGQMIIFVGTFSAVNALNMLIYFFGIVDIPGKIKRGDLDLYLTKPVSPLLRLTFESVNVGSLPLVAMSALIVRYGASAANVDVSLPLGLGYAALVLLMTLLWYDMEIILRSIPFLVITANGIMRVEGEIIGLNFKVPGALYKGFFKILFYFLLPYGIMATIPTQFLTRSVSPAGIAAAVLTVAAFTAFALWFWKFGLRHYKSASS
ncbi:MAG: ABC-2 family transporter protein [Clostridiales bacterium]|jgi:ABC-2 type transport system permease protein|nr:ABC-2 family transporter protein [Clostridiales bacterium]